MHYSLHELRVVIIATIYYCWLYITINYSVDAVYTIRLCAGYVLNHSAADSMRQRVHRLYRTCSEISLHERNVPVLFHASSLLQRALCVYCHLYQAARHYQFFHLQASRHHTVYHHTTPLHLCLASARAQRPLQYSTIQCSAVEFSIVLLCRAGCTNVCSCSATSKISHHCA
jgi:hypothetical protein